VLDTNQLDKGGTMRLGTLLTVPLAIMALTVTTGCPAPERPVTDTAPVTDPATPPPATPTNGIAAPELGIGQTGPGAQWVSSVRLGSQIDATGGVPLGTASSTFRIGEPIHIAMQIDQLPPGGAVRVVWYGAGQQQIHEETRQVQPNTIINFSAPPEVRQTGEYRADVFANGALVKTETFSIRP
jgi:hypothetical protein